MHCLGVTNHPDSISEGLANYSMEGMPPDPPRFN